MQDSGSFERVLTILNIKYSYVLLQFFNFHRKMKKINEQTGHFSLCSWRGDYSQCIHILYLTEIISGRDRALALKVQMKKKKKGANFRDFFFFSSSL